MSSPSVELHSKREARIADFGASGPRGAKWCEKNGYKKKQFYYLVAKFKDIVAQPDTPTQWLRV